MKIIIILLLAVATLAGCDAYSEKKLLELIQEEFKSENYDEVLISAEKFKIKFPNSDSLKVVEEIYIKSKNFNTALEFKRKMDVETTSPLVVASDNTDELKIFNKIIKSFKNKNYTDVIFDCEKFYKNFRTSTKMDSVENIYEKSMDKLEVQEMKEYGSLAFKRYKLRDNPVLNTDLSNGSSKNKSSSKHNIEKHFSKFDGSFTKLRNYIKDNLKDPSSFEHVETRFNDNGDGTLTVLMKYRGKNSFGAVNTEIAKCRLNVSTGDFTDIKVE